MPVAVGRLRLAVKVTTPRELPLVPVLVLLAVIGHPFVRRTDCHVPATVTRPTPVPVELSTILTVALQVTCSITTRHSSIVQ